MNIHMDPKQGGNWYDIVRSNAFAVRRGLDIAGAGVVSENVRGADSVLPNKPGYAAVSETNLDAPRYFAQGNLKSAIEKSERFDLAEILVVLVQVMKTLRQAHRESRHAERDMAETMAKQAANEIRDAAKWNYLGSMLTSFVNIGMGVQGIRSSAGQMRASMRAGKQLNIAANSTKAVKADMKLAQSQTKLAQAKSELAVKGKARTEAKERMELREKVDRMQAEKRPETEIKNSPEQKRLNELGAGEKKAEALKQEHGEAVKQEKAARDQVRECEAGVKTDAEAATRANNRRIKDLEGGIADEKKTAAELKKDPTATKELKASESRLADLEGKLQAAKARGEMYRNPTTAEALGGAAARQADGAHALGPEGDVGKLQIQSEAMHKQAQIDQQVEAAAAQNHNLVATGIGKIAETTTGLVSSEHQAEKAERDAEAQKAASRENEDADFQKNANDLINSAIALMKEYYQSMNQAEASVIRNM